MVILLKLYAVLYLIGVGNMIHKSLLIVLVLSSALFSATCKKPKILGEFPEIAGFSCSDYALFIGFVGITSAVLFWNGVVK